MAQSRTRGPAGASLPCAQEAQSQRMQGAPHPGALCSADHSMGPTALQRPVWEGTPRLPGARAGPDADLRSDFWSSFLPPSTDAPQIVVACVLPSSVLSPVARVLVTSR